MHKKMPKSAKNEKSAFAADHHTAAQHMQQVPCMLYLLKIVHQDTLLYANSAH